MRKSLRGTGLVLGAFLMLAGCGGSTPEDDMVPGEALADSGKVQTPEGLDSCSYVQYCNAPGRLGTVCIYTPGCSESDAYAECLSEVRSICGSGPIYPAERFYHWWGTP